MATLASGEPCSCACLHAWQDILVGAHRGARAGRVGPFGQVRTLFPQLTLPLSMASRVHRTAPDRVELSCHRKPKKNNVLADGVGFEPTRPLRACRFSRPVPSTARPPIQVFDFMGYTFDRDLRTRGDATEIATRKRCVRVLSLANFYRTSWTRASILAALPRARRALNPSRQCPRSLWRCTPAVWRHR
jgi:hypothetical protein